MTRHDWEEVFPGIAPPDNLSEQGKLVFGGGTYYSYFGSYFDILNETSCPLGAWAEASSETDEVGSETPEPPAVQTYDDLISFLDSRGVYYGAGDTEDGGKSVMIDVNQEWADGMIPSDDPRYSVNTVTYYFNENDDLESIALNMTLSEDDLKEYSLWAVCTGSNNCSISGLPEGLVGRYWSEKVNELVERYLNIEYL
ncbi:MAG: hypothetical protein HYY44_01585 [Deltaproteobacteria bacterium]|nr:hypothetical protein [Deltaproteobacteria bacterium]